MASPNDNIPKRPLAPKFLSAFDHRLLVNYPDIWSARAHLVFYYSLLYAIGLYAVSLLMPDNPRSESNIYIWVMMVGTLSFIGVVFWLVFLLRFNVFKRYGRLATGDRLRNFLLYFFALTCLIAPLYIPFVAEKQKADAAFTDDEILADANEANYCIGLLVKDDFELQVSSDTIIIVPTREMAGQMNMQRRDTVLSPEGQVDFNTYYISKEDENDLMNRKYQADSVNMISPEKYVMTKYSNLLHIRPWYLGNDYYYGGYGELVQDEYNYGKRLDSKKHLLSTLELYYRIYRDRPAYTQDQAKKILDGITRKYDYQGGFFDQFADIAYSNSSSLLPDGSNLSEYVGATFKTYKTTRSMTNILTRKHRFSSNEIKGVAKGTLYFILWLTLLLFAFRHMSVKTFFFSLLAAVVLTILTSLVMILTYNTRITGLFIPLVYFITFTAIAASIRLSKQRNMVKGIALNFSFWMIYTIPTLLVSIYYYFLHEAYPTDLFHPENLVYFENESLHRSLAEAGGILLLLGMLHFVYSRWYRSWYSQPEE